MHQHIGALMKNTNVHTKKMHSFQMECIQWVTDGRHINQIMDDGMGICLKSSICPNVYISSFEFLIWKWFWTVLNKQPLILCHNCFCSKSFLLDCSANIMHTLANHGLIIRCNYSFPPLICYKISIPSSVCNDLSIKTKAHQKKEASHQSVHACSLHGWILWYLLCKACFVLVGLHGINWWIVWICCPFSW